MQNRKFQDIFLSARIGLSIRDRIWATLLGTGLSSYDGKTAISPVTRQLLSIWQISIDRAGCTDLTASLVTGVAASPHGLSHATTLVAIAPLLLRYHDNFGQRINCVIALGKQLRWPSELIWQALMLGEVLELALENQPHTLVWARLCQMPARYDTRFSLREAPSALPVLPSVYHSWLQTLNSLTADDLLGGSGCRPKPNVEISLEAALDHYLLHPESYCSAVTPRADSARDTALLTGLFAGAFGGLATIPVNRQLAAGDLRKWLKTIANQIFRQWAGLRPNLDSAIEATRLEQEAAVFPLL